MGERYTIETAGRMLKVSDVAYALNVSEHTIRIWMMEGKISFIKFGKASRISEHELHRLVAKGFQLSQS